MGDPVAIIAVLAACAGYLIGYWRGRKSATAELSAILTPWVSGIKSAVARCEAILIHNQPYVPAAWADDPPSKERMH